MDFKQWKQEPTEPLAILEPENPSIDISEAHEHSEIVKRSVGMQCISVLKSLIEGRRKRKIIKIPGRALKFEEKKKEMILTEKKARTALNISHRLAGFR